MDLESRRLLQDSQSFVESLKLFNKEKPEEKERTPFVEELEVPKKQEVTFRFGFWPEKELVKRADLITFIESFYFKFHSLPNKADFENKFSKNTLPQSSEAWKELLLELQEPLQARGLSPYETPLEYLEPNFVLAVNLITNVLDKRSPAAKLKEAGLTTKQWKALLLKQEHKEYFETVLNNLFDEDTKRNAKLAIQRLVAEGDLQAIKYFNELQDIYRPQTNSSEQVILILQGIMEILALHVSPEILGRVAAEIRTSSILTSSKELKAS